MLVLSAYCLGRRQDLSALVLARTSTLELGHILPRKSHLTFFHRHSFLIDLGLYCKDSVQDGPGIRNFVCTNYTVILHICLLLRRLRNGEKRVQRCMYNLCNQPTLKIILMSVIILSGP